MKLKETKVGEKVLVVFNHKNGIDPMKRIYSIMVTRSELIRGKNGQEYMLTRIGQGIDIRKLSISGNTRVDIPMEIGI